MVAVLVEAGSYVYGTSGSTVAPAVGAQALAFEDDRAVPAGLAFTATALTDPSVTMTGTVTAYDARTCTAQLDVTAVTGPAGSYTGWRFGGADVLRFAGKGYNHPSAPGYYEPWLSNVGLGGVHAFGDGRSFGAAEVSALAVEITNASGSRDHLRKRAYRGRSVRVLLGPDYDAPYGDFAAVLALTGETMVGHGDALLLRLKDLLTDIARPVQADKFLGNNGGPNGFEGSEALEGRSKPLWRGWNFGVTPVLVNEQKAIWQLSRKLMHGLDEVKAGGVPFTAAGGLPSTGHASKEALALDANRPAEGSFAWCFSAEGSFLRLHRLPEAGLTVTGYEGATAADRYPGALWRRTLMEDLGYAAGLVSAADAAAVDAAVPWEVGFYAGPDGRDAKECLDSIAPAVPMAYGPDAVKVWRCWPLLPPSGEPVFTFRRFHSGAVAQADDGDILDLIPVDPQDNDRGLPAHRVGVEFAFNHTVQRISDLLGDPTLPEGAVPPDPVGGPAVRARLAEEWLKVYHPAEPDPAVLDAFPSPLVEPVFRAPLRTRAAALALAARLFALYGVQRGRYTLTFRLGMQSAVAMRPGAVVRVIADRHGFERGKLVRVFGFEPDLKAETVTLDIGGALI